MACVYEHLFSPLKVKNITFRNRIFSAPVMMCMTHLDGTPSPYMIEFFAEKARGGAAMVTIGDTPVDEYHGVSIPSHIILEESKAPFIAELAAAIKENGSVASFELNHSGQAAQPKSNREGGLPWGPTGFVRKDGVQVLEMTEEMMDHTADCYAKAAALLKKTGWDMCILHGAHGWLLGQFLSSATNKRMDGYGGSLENRAKFPLMVIDRVRKAVGVDFVIDYRISGDEKQPNGLTIDECIQFVKMAQGKIDMIHVSAGLDTDLKHAIITHPNSYLPNGVNVQYAEKVKKAGVKIPVTTVGGINAPEMAEEIIASGKADAVAMARALIADPWWPEKVRSGKLNSIYHCIRCTNCLAEMHPKQQFYCDVNPITGHEVRHRVVDPVKKLRTVYVVGGGPGGMEAAITAAERGHKVTLLEKSDHLGGTLCYTDNDLKFKKDLNIFKEKMIHRVAELPIKVRLGVEVTPELIKTEKPDALLVAVGSVPFIPPIPGIESSNAITAFSMYQSPESVKGKVVVIGGGLVGCECAVYLADMGHPVTVIEMTGKLMPDANMHHRTAVKGKMEGVVTTMLNTRCNKVTLEGVGIIGEDGKESVVAADAIIIATGYKSNSKVVESLRNLTDEFVVIGDCKKVTRVKGPIHDGYFAAMNL
jgi:2,4-dienoyl-CoA reductase-like NADH-dependent reductase (Old Yellow Enzyme family)/thioredoxin reductase